MLNVLFGRKTIVGYQFISQDTALKLPKLRPGILSPLDNSKNVNELSDKLNLIYARDYHTSNDLSILLKAWRKLDR